MAIKRSSSAGVSPAKRRSTSGKVNLAKKCELVQAAVRGAQVYPEGVRKMVAAHVVSCLKVPKEERHEFQQQSVSMIGEILASEEGRLRKVVQEAEAKFSTTTGEKSSRDQAHESTTSALASQHEATNSAKATLAEGVANTKAAKASLVEAEAAQKDGHAKSASAEEKRMRLETALNEAFAALEDGSAQGGDARSKAASVTKAAKECKIDAGLLASLGATLGKDPADRGTYDALVMRQLKAELKTHVSSAAAAVASAEAEKAGLASSVDTAKASLAEAQEKEAVCKAAADQSKQELEVAKANERETTKAVANFASEFKRAEKSLAGAKTALSVFDAGALAAYKELLEHTAVKPVEAEPEPADAAAVTSS